MYSLLEKQTTVVHVSPTEDDPSFGFDLKTDDLYKQVYIGDASKKLIASSIYKSKNSFRNNLKDTFLTHINDISIFSKSNAVK